MAIIPLSPAESILRSADVGTGPAGGSRLAHGGCVRPAMLGQAVGWNLPTGESVKISQPFEVTPTECSN